MENKEKPVLGRIKENRKDVLLFLLSLIQGLAFTKLLEISFNMYNKSTTTVDNFTIILHSFICFLIIIRLFEALLLGFLDYSEAVSSMYEAVMIFVIGALEYWLIVSISEFNLLDFDPSQFYLRLIILTSVSSIGYLITTIKISHKKYRRKIFLNKTTFQFELILQTINIGVVIIIAIISILLFNETLETKLHTNLAALLISISIIFNIISSWYLTVTSPKSVIEWPDDQVDNKHLYMEFKSFKTKEILEKSENPIIRKAQKFDSIEIASLYISLFPYVFRNVFDTSDRIINKILSKIIAFNEGNSYWGYNNTYVACNKVSGEIVGFLVIKPNKRSSLQGILLMLYVTFLMIYCTGFIGVIRLFKNIITNKGATHSPVHEELYISYLGTRTEFQRKGVSDELLTFAEKVAMKLKLKSIGLDVRENNLSAISLFIKKDFKVEKIIKDNAFDYPTRIYMKKTIIS